MIRRTLRTSRSGFTLVEFAIANLAAMAMMAATFTVMGAIFKSNDRMGDMMVTQQNVRAAINTIGRDITMAGTGLPSSGVAVPGGLNSTPIIRPGMAAFSSPEREIVLSSGVLPMISPGNNGGPTIAGTDTDVLTVFSIDQDSPSWTVDSVSGFNDRYEITFSDDISMGSMQLNPGDVLIFTNVNGSVLACLSDISEMTHTLGFFRLGDAMGVNQPTAETGNIASLKNEGTDPPVFPLITAVRASIVNYFITVDDAGHSRLMRAVNAQAPQRLADEIENLQLSFDLYDFSSNTENSNQATVATPSQIRAVNVSISGRSREKLEKTNDYFRFALVSKVGVRNATFRNRYSSGS